MEHEAEILAHHADAGIIQQRRNIVETEQLVIANRRNLYAWDFFFTIIALVALFMVFRF